MANRYDIVTGKIPVKPAEEVVSDLEKQFKIKQTTKKSTSMALRGPNGFEIFIPVKNIRFHQEENAGNYEFHLEIPRSAGASLAADISRANPDAAIRSPRALRSSSSNSLRDRVRRSSSIEESGPEEEENERMIPQQGPQEIIRSMLQNGLLQSE